MAQMERINFWLGVSNWIKGEERKNIQRRRLQIADEIPTKYLGMAIEAIYQLIKDEKDDAKKVINRRILTKLIERVDNELFPQSKWPDPKERGLARGLYYELHVGLGYLAADPIQAEELKRKQEEDNSFLQGIQDLEKLQEIMSSQAFQSLPVLHIAESPLSFSERVFKRFIEKEAINKKPTKKKIDDSIAFASDWSKSVSALYQQKGVVPMEASTIFTYVIASLYSAIPEKNKKLKDQARDKASQTDLVKKGFFEVEERTVPEEAKEKASQIGEDIFGRTPLNKKFNLSDFQDVIERITNEVKNKSPEYVIDFFFEIWREDVPELPSAPGKVEDYELAERQDIKLKLKNYILFRLFEMSVSTFEQFRFLTEEAKRALILGGLHYFVYAYAYPDVGYELILEKNNQGVLLLVEYEATYPSDLFVIEEVRLGETPGETDLVDVSMIDPEDRQYLNRILTSIEEVWMQPDRTRQDIVNLYQYLVEGKLGSELTEKGMKTVITEQIFTKILARYLAKFSKWGDFFKEIAALEKLGVPVSGIIRRNRNEFGQMLSKLWLSLPEEPNGKELEQINKAVEFIEDPFLRVQLQSYYYAKLWPTLNFDERLDILFSKSSAGIFDLKRFHEFIEKEAKTEAQLRSALERLRKEFNLFMTTGSRELGLATIFSNFRADPKSAQDLIAALLQTWQSDSLLKQVLYQNIAEWSKLEERESPESDKEALMAINGMVQIAEKVENLIFRMDASAKYVLLRKLLTGDKGLVSVQNNRSSFLQALVTSTVSGENEVGLMAVIGEVIQALGGIKLWKPIYFALQQLLVDRIAIPPKRLSKWMNILEHEVEADFEDKSVLKGLVGRGYLTPDQLSKRVKTFEKTPWRYESEFLIYSEEILRSRLTERGVVTPPTEKGQLTPLSFTLEFAQNTGALGVRFLQLLPQFAELPEKYQDEFSKVYDSVYGQSKLTALAVLEREWPDFWKQVVSIEERVGGGSLMTVYKIKTTDGKEEVVKVLNPNLQFHLQNNIKVINELLDVLTKRYGPKYQLARLVVEEVKEWIERDVRFENFLEKDRQFRADNDGFTQQGLAYKIYVPRSEGPENHYFMREEYIEGDNLTQWDKLQAEGHDLKDIISLLVKNYVEQLRRGFAHSDVHVGNFRVMKDKRVAILDRNFYLELKPEVKDLVNAVLNPFQLIALSSGEFIGKLVKISETNIPQDKREVLKQSWEWTKAEILKGDWKSISRFLVDLRKNGLKLPLEVTLVFKNINSLQQMSRRAGFNNLVEAYLYSGSGKRRAEVREAPIAQFGVEKVNDIASKVALFLAPPEVRSELRDVQIDNPKELVNNLIQFHVKADIFAQALRDQTNLWLERIEKEKQGLVGLDIVKDRISYWIGLLESLKNRKFDISVKVSRQDDELGIKNIAEALTKARNQIERVIISSQDGKVNHDLTATLKENDLFFTVLKSLERFNTVTLTDQATLPVVSKTNAFDDLKANPALFGVGVTDTEGISDPLVEVAESTLQVVAALLRADKIKEAKQLQNPEELKKIDAELLRELFIGYSEGNVVKFDGANVFVSRSELRQYLLEYMAQRTITAAA